jgi:hypothetical protein
MAETRKYHCDRCGKTILENRTFFTPPGGFLKNRLSNGLDLCEGCGEQLLNWLKDRQAAGGELAGPVAKSDEIPLGPVGKVARRIK